ncbi:LuxR C-terminal-related transcriptional regulator [Gordonia sp. SL306]|uniref:LuxR C-terminal-related transcriptional regulator n=1 Tax=Gordonia sp. SL306 TaxID=2995145 RepID=UPI00226DB8FB|nr:LuxR C-terminal-related transcriptional regulator [Gordonia sp. SL306]WAC55274.1 LuxR C-terminal-related transcriptional regulator [Gordonia sp. SL306]
MTVIAHHVSQHHSSVAAPDRPVRDARRHTEATRRRQEALARLAQRRMPLPGRPLDTIGPGAPRTGPGRAHMTLVTSEIRAESDRPHCSCGTDSADSEHPSLTTREIEVLRTWLMLDSKTAVAQALFISLGTVNTHLTRIRAKYSEAGRTASTKAALVARAVQDGLISLDEL